MGEEILSVQHLEKKFGDNTVLRDIDFQVEAGEVNVSKDGIVSETLISK